MKLNPTFPARLALAAWLCAAVAPAAETPAPAGPLAPILQSLVERHIVAGAVALVADKDRVLDLEAAGYASLATKAPMRADNLFWLASMTKSVTATALMMLVDEGSVNVDDPVEKYLPEFKGQGVADKSGLEDVALDKSLPPAFVEKLGHGAATPPPALLAEFGGSMIAKYARHYAEPAGGLFSTGEDQKALYGPVFKAAIAKYGNLHR